MTPSSLFEIHHLQCGYHKVPVIEIKQLFIPSRKLTMIVGASGIGKSTLLESLSLINDTLIPCSRSSFLFHSPTRDKPYDFAGIWKEKKNKISSIRKSHFSFMFQSYNLMPNFPAFDNMCLGALSQGISFDNAASRVHAQLESIFDDYVFNSNQDRKEYFDKHIGSFSEGQRQRMAFVRAVCKDYHVLFGDEPTGNLDYQKAVEVIRIIKEDIANSEQPRSAVIVTHDLNLAVNHSNKIYVFRKEGQIGVIDEKGEYKRKGKGFNNHKGEFISKSAMIRILRESMSNQNQTMQ